MSALNFCTLLSSREEGLWEATSAPAATRPNDAGMLWGRKMLQYAPRFGDFSTTLLLPSAVRSTLLGTGTAGTVEVEEVAMSAPVALAGGPAPPPPRSMCSSPLPLLLSAAERRAVWRLPWEGRGGAAAPRSVVRVDVVLLGNCGVAVGSLTKASEGGERDAPAREPG